MVAHFLRLKVRLLANAFKRSPWRIVGLVIGIAYGLAATAVAVAALVALRMVPAEVAAPAVVTAGSLVVLGFLLLPLAFGVDDTLDPRRFALFGIPSSRLATGLAAAAIVGVPGLAITVVAFMQIVTWSRNPLAVGLGIVSWAVIVVTCVLGARVTTSLAAFLLASRRAKELTGIIAILVIVLLSPAFSMLAAVDWREDGLATLGSIAGAAGWTPLGAAWSAPALASSGSPGAAVAQALIGIAFAGALWLAWRALVVAMLVAPERQSPSKRYLGLGWFDRLPARPTGAVAARSLTYWARDGRYRVSLAIIPVVPLLWMLPLLIAGADWHQVVLLPIPIMCLFAAWTSHNDIAYDNTAFWLHVASNIPGRADRIGRAAPMLIFGVPLLLVGSVAAAWLHGDWSVLPSLIGLSSCVLLAGLGLSSFMSARFPYPAVRPGDSPFQQPQSSGSASALIQSLSFFASVIIAAPVLVLGVLGYLFGGYWPLAALLTGLGMGAAGLIAGVLLGARVFDRRSPELLAFTMRN